MRQLKSLQMIRRKHDIKVETKTTCQNAKQQQQQQQQKKFDHRDKDMRREKHEH